jgi:hypothetical protein
MLAISTKDPNLNASAMSANGTTIRQKILWKLCKRRTKDFGSESGGQNVAETEAAILKASL